MKKLSVIGTNNDGYRHYYRIKKDDYFPKLFIPFMKEAGFKGSIDYNYLLDEKFKDYELVPYYEFSEFYDKHQNFNNKDFDIDLFLGKDEVLVVIRTKSRKKLLKLVEKHFTFNKVKK